MYVPRSILIFRPPPRIAFFFLLLYRHTAEHMMRYAVRLLGVLVFMGRSTLLEASDIAATHPVATAVFLFSAVILNVRLSAQIANDL